MNEADGVEDGSRKLRLQEGGVDIVFTGTKWLEKGSQFLQTDAFICDSIPEGLHTTMESELEKDSYHEII